ncbi:MAG TPA: HAMP domain-containing sensor histidine kinase [Rhizomicrobium sp.]|nr:HAMP domain-containing sensor histidine kinase [Rhizomicrobium sp.]
MVIQDLAFHAAISDLSEWTAGRLATQWPPLPETATCGEVFDWFSKNPEQSAVAIVDAGNIVVGLVNRLRFLARYSQRFIHELYSRRPIAKMANNNPLVVEESLTVAQVSARMVVERPDALVECFVVTRQGRYLGIGTGEALMRCKVDLLQLQEKSLSRALEHARAADRAKGHFLALMSHELRTPLNAIIGFSEVLSGEFFGPLGSDRYKSYAADIHLAGNHLLRLINEILDLSRAEAGKLELRPENLTLPSIVAECVKLVADRAKGQGVSLSVDMPGRLPPLHADELRVKQILLNLLSNAIKFTPEGGRVEVGVAQDRDGGIVLSVSDTGIGMAPDMISVALEPFRQIDSPMSRKQEGSGLGLSLVKSLAELHQATLSIESALAQGTTVRITFPPERTLSDRAVA